MCITCPTNELGYLKYSVSTLVDNSLSKLALSSPSGFKYKRHAFLKFAGSVADALATFWTSHTFLTIPTSTFSLSRFIQWSCTYYNKSSQGKSQPKTSQRCVLLTNSALTRPLVFANITLSIISVQQGGYFLGYLI